MNQYPVENLCVYDLEVFPDYFLAGFEFPNGQVNQFIFTPFYNPIDEFMNFLNQVHAAGYTLAGFNSSGYDDLVLTAFLNNPNPSVAFAMSVEIIQGNTPRWQFDNQINAIDLMQILPNRISLKKIGVCLGHKKLQELPVAYDKVPTPEEQNVLASYNVNDLEITRKLQVAIQPELELRKVMSERYGVDLRSKGEATLAELALLEEYKRLGGTETKRQLNDKARQIVGLEGRVWVSPPSWWNFAKEKPQAAKVVEIGEQLFQTPIPIIDWQLASGFIDRQVYLDDRYYTMGVGGLHSVDGPGCWIPGDDEVLVDIDVASYYPNIILTQKLEPRQWAGNFLPIYNDIVQRRLAAKKSGDKTTADILKISANGTYGKSSDKYSSLYDPQLTVNVTVLGQLGLLYLIAQMEGWASVVSANTDGITLLCKRDDYQEVQLLVKGWEYETGLEMEYTEYTGLYQRDVNNYIAMKTDGKIKSKGRFIDDWPDLRHTPNANIVAAAIKAFVSTGTPVANTIYGCTDINQFILTEAVTGNTKTSWNGRTLGKMLRFYKSNDPDAGPIIRVSDTQEKIVANSEGCVPLEDLPDEFPEDINYQWYIDEATKLTDAITKPKVAGMNRWAELLHQKGLRPCYVDLTKKQLSRAAVKYGEVDFTSRPDNCVMGTGTGEGLLATVSDERTAITAVDKPHPGKTRAKIKKDHGFDLIYGARVPLKGFYKIDTSNNDFDEFYTPAELKKVGR